MSHIQKVGMVILMQPDVEKAVEFYTNLGLQQVFYIPQKWAEFQIGSVKLGLCPTSQPQDDNRTGIVLEVDDLAATYQALKDTVHFVTEPKEAIHGHMVAFKDPGGNILDLYQPTPEKVHDLVKKVKAQGCCKQDDQDAAGCCKAGDN